MLKHIGSFNKNEYVEDYNEYRNEISHQLIEDIEWILFEYPVCHNLVLVSEYYCFGMPDGYSELTIEYPNLNINYQGVPSVIKNAFTAAVRTKGIDRAICLLSLRRTLEMICKDKNAEGNNLQSKIQDLVDKKVLPEMMNNACWILRQLDNDAAMKSSFDEINNVNN